MGRGKVKRTSKNFKELFVNADTEFLDFLVKSDNGKSLENFTTKEREKFYSQLIEKLKFCSGNENVENNVTVKNILELVLHILEHCNFEIETEKEFLNLLSFINSKSLICFDNSLKNSVSLINEYWICKKTECVISEMEYFTLKYLLEICLVEKPLISDIQRLNAIRKVITPAPFETAVPSLRPLLIKVVQNETILNSENGQRFLGHAMILSQRVMLDIHKTILLELGSCSKKKATAYGKIYVIAWQNAKSDMKSILEKSCFQHIMESFLKGPRTSLELTKVGQNILSALDVWHSERKKKNAEFITMITDCYQPFIWKYLESGFNVHRCNAIDLFFKAFPLQRPNDNVMDAERLFNQQFNVMLSALRDDCHIVRIIAIREVCNILSHYWNSFTPIQIQNLLTIITKEDAHDASTADVRRMVYIGFQSFLNNPLAFDYLAQILPAMADNIHDVNQKVRIAFIQLLIAVKEKGDPKIKYSDLVPAFSLYYRLAEENIKAGQLIVKLLLSSYYQESMPAVEWTKRFIFLIKTYPRSYRNFFMFSEKMLPFSNAFTIMCEILVQLGSYVMSKSEENADENEYVFENQNKKMKCSRKKKPLRSSNASKSMDTEKNKVKECAFDDPLVIEGLFDIVCILWVVHDNELNQPANQDKRIKLYDTYIKYAQPFINYYKDSALLNSVISLSGNIPSSLLRNNSITLPGYCLKMLKSNKLDSSDIGRETILTMLVALIKWGKGGDILEQVTLWLDAAFETQNLNSTILPMRRVKISETIQPNSIVAINILNILMKTEHVKMSILKKNYAQLFELWKLMSRIKTLIENRLDQGEPFEDELVSDEFIKICFRRYIKLIPLLKRDEQKEREGEVDLVVNYQQEIENLIQWAAQILFPLLEENDQSRGSEDISLVISIYNDILYVADNMIIVHLVNKQFYSKITQVTLKLLETKHCLSFMKEGSRIAAVINYSGKMLFNVSDDPQIFSRIVPCIVSRVLNVLTNQKFSDEEITFINEELPTMKVSLTKILLTYQDNFRLKINSRETVKQLQMLIGIFLDTIVTALSKEITPESLHLPLYSNLNQMPPIVSALFSLFYNKKFWGPMLIHVLNASLGSKLYGMEYLLACVIILHMYANYDKKINKTELKKTISSATNVLNKAKSELVKETERSCTSDNNSALPNYGSPYSSGTELNSSIHGTHSERNPKYLPESLIQEGLQLLSEMQILMSARMEEENE